jgi:four helix bundle protein
LRKTNGKNTIAKYDLEDRLTRFVVLVLGITKKIKCDTTGEYLSNQIERAACSAALNYGEVQGTLSKRDYRFRAAVVLKELKETRVALKLIKEISMVSGNLSNENELLTECEELIAIVATLIKNR